MKKATFIFFVAILSLGACRKDKAGPTLQGKWTLDNILVKEYINGALENTMSEPGNGTVWDFRDNGHVVMTEPGSSPETHTYSVQANSKVNIDGFVFEIKSLDAVSATLYIRQDDSQERYTEVFNNL